MFVTSSKIKPTKIKSLQKYIGLHDGRQSVYIPIYRPIYTPLSDTARKKNGKYAFNIFLIF